MGLGHLKYTINFQGKYQLYHTSVLGKEINYIYRELAHCKHNVKPSLLLKHRED
jgi:hypothetical protein